MQSPSNPYNPYTILKFPSDRSTKRPENIEPEERPCQAMTANHSRAVHHSITGSTYLSYSTPLDRLIDQVIQACISSGIQHTLFMKSLPNTSSSQNLTWTQSYSQFKILQQSQCNRRTKRPGNIEPDEDIYHVHFKPNKIRCHPYKQKYCVIHINSSLFGKMLNRNRMLSMTSTSEQDCLLL